MNNIFSLGILLFLAIFSGTTRAPQNTEVTHQKDIVVNQDKKTPAPRDVKKDTTPLPNPPEGMGIRAALDFTIEVTEAGKKITVQSDFGSYTFADGLYAQTYGVQKDLGKIQMAFRKEGQSIDAVKKTPVMTSTTSYFLVPLNQVFELNIGQTVRYGSSIEIKLISIEGSGCPEGVMC